MMPDDNVDVSSGPELGLGSAAATLDLRTTLLVIAVVILVAWALHALTPIMVPLVAAILIALAVMSVRD